MKFKKGDVTYDGRLLQFKVGILGEMKKVWWDKDVENEARNAERWLTYNLPKKNYTKFFCNWLNRANRSLNFQERKKLDEMPQQQTERSSSQLRMINFNEQLKKLSFTENMRKLNGIAFKKKWDQSDEK